MKVAQVKSRLGCSMLVMCVSFCLTTAALAVDFSSSNLIVQQNSNYTQNSPNVNYQSDANSRKAVSWYKKAAAQGHADAQYSLGLRYYSGQGIEQDSAKAAYWYQAAANQGLDLAQYAIGWMYYNGEGVEQNSSEAMTWYKAAANQGHTEAQYAVGWMYDNDKVD